MTPEEEKTEKRLAKYRKYNMSSKGQKRHQKYEDVHPGRKERWAPIMLLKARDKR